MTLTDLRGNITVSALTQKRDLEDMTLEAGAEAAFVISHTIDLTAHAHQNTSVLETDVHDGTMNIRVPINSYVTCPA